jgi:hypothetical protein
MSLPRSNATESKYFEMVRAAETATTAHAEKMEGLIEELAADLIKKGGQCGIDEGIASIYGIGKARDYHERERVKAAGLLKAVQMAPLGKLAVFNHDGTQLELVGALKDEPLTITIGYQSSSDNIHSRHLGATANFAFALQRHITRIPALAEYQTTDEHMLSHSILSIENDHLWEPQVANVTVLRGVEASFEALHTDDSIGRLMMGVFYDQLLVDRELADMASPHG